MIAREVILRLDITMESMGLTSRECNIRAHLKQTYLGLSLLERTMAHLHAKITWLSGNIWTHLKRTYIGCCEDNFP
jgi:hypothetical protein